MYEFLDFASKRYELVLFTAASRVYANAIVDALESRQKYFSHRLYREHCTSLVQDNGEAGYPVKYLNSVADRATTKSFLIDDNPIHTVANPGSSLLVKAFEPDTLTEDKELLGLQAVLSTLVPIF